jgi:hypothetical protein
MVAESVSGLLSLQFILSDAKDLAASAMQLDCPPDASLSQFILSEAKDLRRARYSSAMAARCFASLSIN